VNPCNFIGSTYAVVKTQKESHKVQSVYAYTPKVLVEQFDIAMDHFQYKQLIITGFHTAAEVQTRIPSTRQAQSLNDLSHEHWDTYRSRRSTPCCCCYCCSVFLPTPNDSLFYFTNLQSLHKSRSERETLIKYNIHNATCYLPHLCSSKILWCSLWICDVGHLQKLESLETNH